MLNGNLINLPQDEAVTYANLNGLLQREPGAARAVHLPLALWPSPYPRGVFEHATKVLCPTLLQLIHAASQDHDFLEKVLTGAAEDLHKSGEPRMKRLLSFLRTNPQPISLIIARMDWMLDSQHKPKLVEANLISAAFLYGAPRVQRMHKMLMRRADAPSLAGNPAPVTDSDVKATALLAMAHKQYQETRKIPNKDTLMSCVVVFVVLDNEHLLVESLLEQQLQEVHNIRVECLTLPGCSDRLRLKTDKRLLLDDKWEVSVVYFRGGVFDECYSEDGWEVIEQSMAIKTPSVACLLAGSKVVQAALCDRAIIDRFLPNVSSAAKEQLYESLTEGRVVGENPATLRIENPENLILKKEQGVCTGSEMLKLLSELKSARQYMLYNKIEPVPVQNVSFVRDNHIVETGPGVQELGTYGLYLGGHPSFPPHVEYAGYLVRTKPEREVDGGVCKGVAVMDSVLLVD